MDKIQKIFIILTIVFLSFLNPITTSADDNNPFGDLLNIINSVDDNTNTGNTNNQEETTNNNPSSGLYTPEAEIDGGNKEENIELNSADEQDVYTEDDGTNYDDIEFNSASDFTDQIDLIREIRVNDPDKYKEFESRLEAIKTSNRSMYNQIILNFIENAPELVPASYYIELENAQALNSQIENTNAVASNNAVATTTTNTAAAVLPKTGPEHIFLLLLSFLMAGFIYYKKRMK